MITAHAPAGYLVAQCLRRLKPANISARRWSLYGAVGGLLPDVDMFWFYLIDGSHVHHHRYPTHWPLLWLLVLVGALIFWHKTRRPVAAIAFSLFTVSARYQPWWLNFILHWSFLLELALWAAAIRVFLYNRQTPHD